jgi:hypothetical protein
VVLLFIVTVLCSTVLSEIAIYSSDSLSASYIAISIYAGLAFLCSGLILKSGSFPLWMRPWATSLSMLRWTMQAGFINIYNDNLDAFPMIFPKSTYTQYFGYLSLFGWGGKTEWYCLGMIVINILIFRAISLAAQAYSAFKARGTHKKEIEF